MDEKRTRQEIIDRNLWLAGWNVKYPSQVTEELDISYMEAMLDTPAKHGDKA